jgi:membrane-associated phospholipid phosphatase
MPTIKERKYPLYIHIIILLMVVYKVLPNNHTLELHFFFLGLIVAAMTALLLLFLKFKASMHLMGMGSLFMLLVCLSIHFELNITLALSLLTVATGLVATSRLYLKAHSRTELLIGFMVGSLSQLFLVKFWL